MEIAVKNRIRARGISKVDTVYPWAICIASALVVLLINSKCSPLYPTNDWIDSNAYLTIGRAMLHGQIPYRDLVDHKGPLLYMLHALAACISPYTFRGVFVFEVIAGAVYCRFAVKIAQLYAPDKVAWLTAPLVAVVTYTMPAMSEGDSAEEFCLPLLMAGLYCFLRFLQDKERRISPAVLVANGIFAGIIFWDVRAQPAVYAIREARPGAIPIRADHKPDSGRDLIGLGGCRQRLLYGSPCGTHLPVLYPNQRRTGRG